MDLIFSNNVHSCVLCLFMYLTNVYVLDLIILKNIHHFKIPSEIVSSKNRYKTFLNLVHVKQQSFLL